MSRTWQDNNIGYDRRLPMRESEINRRRHGFRRFLAISALIGLGIIGTDHFQTDTQPKPDPTLQVADKMRDGMARAEMIKSGEIAPFKVGDSTVFVARSEDDKGNPTERLILMTDSHLMTPEDIVREFKPNDSNFENDVSFVQSQGNLTAGQAHGLDEGDLVVLPQGSHIPG